MIEHELNLDNYNDFTIVDAHDGIERQFILKRYGYSYTMLDIGNPHYLKLDKNMGYVFKVQPGHYTANIEGDSIFVSSMTEEQYNESTKKTESN